MGGFEILGILGEAAQNTALVLSDNAKTVFGRLLSKWFSFVIKLFEKSVLAIIIIIINNEFSIQCVFIAVLALLVIFVDAILILGMIN